MNEARFTEFLKRALAPREVKVSADYDPIFPFDTDWLEIDEYVVAKLESGKVLLTRGYEVPSGSHWDPPDYDFAEVGEFSYPAAVAEAILTDDIKHRLAGLGEEMSFEEECEYQTNEYADGRMA